MATAFTWILVAFLGTFMLAGIIGFFVLIVNRMRRESRGDVFLMNRDTQNGSPPVELRSQNDYRYKDAGVDPYKK